MKHKEKIAVKASLQKSLSAFARSRENEETDGQEKNPQFTASPGTGSVKREQKLTKASRSGFAIAVMRGADSFLDPDEDRPE